MWHRPVWSIRAGCRSSVACRSRADMPLLIFCSVERNSDSQCSLVVRVTPKIVPSRAGSRPPSTISFPEPTQVSPPNGISICSDVFLGLTNVTNRHTQRYSICSNRPHLQLLLRCGVNVIKRSNGSCSIKIVRAFFIRIEAIASAEYWIHFTEFAMQRSIFKNLNSIRTSPTAVKMRNFFSSVNYCIPRNICCIRVIRNYRALWHSTIDTESV